MSDRLAHLRDPVLYERFYQYNETPGRIVPMKRWEPRLVWALNHVGPSDDVLDVGCHKGEMTFYLWSRTTGYVAGLDINRLALADARSHAARAGIDIDFLEGRAEAMPLPDNRFDVVVLCELLEHVIDPVPVLAEAERVCRHGGLIVTSTPRNAVEMDRQGEAWQRDQESGFRLDRHVREFDPAEWFQGKAGLRLAQSYVYLSPGRAEVRVERRQSLSEGVQEIGFYLASYRVTKG